MENEIPTSQPPFPQPGPQTQEDSFNPYPDIESMKAQARELALKQVLASRVAAVTNDPQTAPQPQAPQIIYLRRNLTVAELIVVFAIACGLVYGVPNLIKIAADRLPQIEIKVK